MPDSFTDIEKVTRSHILAANMLARLEVPKKGILSSQVMMPMPSPP